MKQNTPQLPPIPPYNDQEDGGPTTIEDPTKDPRANPYLFLPFDDFDWGDQLSQIQLDSDQFKMRLPGVLNSL